MQDIMSVIGFTTQDLVPVEAVAEDIANIPLQDETFLKVIGDLILNPHKDEPKPDPIVKKTASCEEESSDTEYEEVEDEMEVEIPLSFLEKMPQVLEQVSHASQLFFKEEEKIDEIEEKTEDEQTFKQAPSKTNKEVLIKPGFVPELPEVEPEIAVKAATEDSKPLPIELTSSKEKASIEPNIPLSLPKEVHELKSPIHEEAQKSVRTPVPTLENNQILPMNVMHALVKELEMPLPTQVQMREISLPTHEPDWGKELNQQIVWLGQQNIKSAQIKLNPEALGPLNIHLSVKNKETTLHITSNNSEVRDLIGHQIPELKEKLQEQGLQLTKVNIEAEVNSHHAREQFVPKQQPRNEARAQLQENVEERLVETSKMAVGIIDYFA